MKSRRNPSWRCGYLNVSKIERRMSPAVPAIPKMTEDDSQRSYWTNKKTADNILARAERNFSALVVLRSNLPECRNHRSAANERSRKTVVTQEPAMKSGLSPSAPISIDDQEW